MFLYTKCFNKLIIGKINASDKEASVAFETYIKSIKESESLQIRIVSFNFHNLFDHLEIVVA